MNLISSLKSLFGLTAPAISKPVPQDNRSVNTLMLLQQMCAAVPGGNMLVGLSDGELALRLTWDKTTDNDKSLIFSLSGTSKDIAIYKEEEEQNTTQESPQPITKEQPKPKEKTIEETLAIEDMRAERREQRKAQQQLKTMTTLEQYLADNYDFRYNRITEQTECAHVSQNTYRPVDDRLRNSIILGALKSGITCWDRDVNRIITSTATKEYHPFSLYFDSLPEWDGKDRVTPLAQRVSDDALWVKSFHRWMLATVAQWMNRNGERANSVAPILISTKQGWGKSTFCRMLLPTELRRYFTESYDLNAQSSAETKLATFGLINLDEFDKLSVKKMPLLKNLMQMESLNLRKAYKHSDEPLDRIASFIGTSNRRDLLTDTTGSRRFICVELQHEIDCSPIEYAQLYAQLKHELNNGARYWFTKTEEAEIQQHNKPYYRNSPEEEIFHKCFKVADNDINARIYTASEIYEVMRKSYPSAMRGVTLNSLSRLLPTLAPRVHTKYCNGYWLERV